jgi:hypothetical protein
MSYSPEGLAGVAASTHNPHTLRDTMLGFFNARVLPLRDFWREPQTPLAKEPCSTTLLNP